MGNKTKKPTTARRVATLLAVLGVLVMSSGVALMATATSATAAVKPSICHPVNGKGELGNGWNLISPDKASSHINEALYPNGTYWKHMSKDGLRHDMYAVNGTCPGPAIELPKCPEDTDRAGQEIPAGETAEEFCNNEAPPPVCEKGTDNAGDVIPQGQTAEEFCNEKPPALCADGTDKAGQEIPAGSTAEAFCTNVVTPPVVSPPVVSPPVVSPPKAHVKNKTHAATVTPTVVHAGLTSVSGNDLRGEQGLALMVAGMVMLVAAGGLGLRLRGAASRI